MTRGGGFREWEDLLDSLRLAGEETLQKVLAPDDRQVRTELVRMLLASLSHAYINKLYSDPSYPEIYSFLGLYLNLLAPVPDFMYEKADIDGHGVYKVTGNRGTIRFVAFNVCEEFSTGGAPGAAVLNAYDADDNLTLSKNGDFEVILSAERPSGYSGDWWKMDRRARVLLIRRAGYDWLNEVDPRLMIERLDVPARKPRPTVDQIKMDLAMIAPWTKAMVGLWLDHVKHEWDEGRINRVEVQGFKDMGSIAVANDQTYLEGFYDLAPDEALLMATEIPKTCRYWSVLVTDELYGTLDWMNRFSSINGHQAILSSDGKFRAVLSAQDPGVPNWIDVGDYRRGLIQVRWNRADSAPLPQCTKINVSDVWQHMPSDTPRVSPAERDELLRIRRRGAQKRIVW